MDGFAIPLVVFSGFMMLLLAEMFRGSFEDAVPRRAGVTWAVTCPLSGLLFGVGLAPLAIISGAISMLALGSLGYWFLATEPDDSEDEAAEETDPDPGPSDDIVLEIPKWALRAEENESGIDWDAFDRARIEWEKESAPERKPERIPEPEPERVPVGV
jgi:hypothetical protein